MANFQEVMGQFDRMCKASRGCVDCPLHEPDGVSDRCSIGAFVNDSEHIEREIMSWAAEHPEPVYPTWGEWLESEGICFSRLTNYERIGGFSIPQVFDYQIDGETAFICGDKVNTPIPADIAQKLGIEPKEDM